MIGSSNHVETVCAVAGIKGRTGGYSLVETVIAMVILLILTAVSLPYIVNYKRLYKTEDQAIKVMDLMREAGQLALTKRRTIRVDIDLSNPANPVIRMADNSGATDILAKTIPLEPSSQVRMDIAPTGVAVPAPPGYAIPTLAAGVWSLQFRTNGSVTNAAGIPISGTLILWPPSTVPYNASNLTPRSPSEVRAITVFGGSGAVRYWKYNGATFVPYS